MEQKYLLNSNVNFITENNFKNSEVLPIPKKLISNENKK